MKRRSQQISPGVLCLSVYALAALAGASAGPTPRKLMVTCAPGSVPDPVTGGCGDVFQVVQDEDSDIIAKTSFPPEAPVLSRRLLHLPFKAALTKSCTSAACCSKRALHLATANGCLPCTQSSCTGGSSAFTTVNGRNGCVCKLSGSCPVHFNNKCHKLPLKLPEPKPDAEQSLSQGASAEAESAKGKGMAQPKRIHAPRGPACNKKACCDSLKLATAARLGCRCPEDRCKEGGQKLVHLLSQTVKHCKCVFKGSCPVRFSRACKVKKVHGL